EPSMASWPPGRNQPCWCGSGRKYKKCCAAPSLVDAEPHK
ncbi:MAG: SEC-C metal-binding domain-containing protein, partial [Mycobacterium sp.]